MQLIQFLTYWVRRWMVYKAHLKVPTQVNQQQAMGTDTTVFMTLEAVPIMIVGAVIATRVARTAHAVQQVHAVVLPHAAQVRPVVVAVEAIKVR